MSKKSGLADSPFFSLQPLQTEQAPLPTVPKPLRKPQKTASPLASIPPTPKPETLHDNSVTPQAEPPRNRDTTQPRYHDTTVSRYHDAMIELVRKAVKEFGKEAATHRFTSEEKKAIADLLYSYKAQGVKTSENEIARIAINFIVQDYRENGENSILDKVLRALNE